MHIWRDRSIVDRKLGFHLLENFWIARSRWELIDGQTLAVPFRHSRRPDPTTEYAIARSGIKFHTRLETVDRYATVRFLDF